MKRVKLLDREFELSIPSSKIQEVIQQIANQLNEDLKDKEVVFICILNGAFMFASDLYRRTNFNSVITFSKLSSYQGTSTTGRVKELIGMTENVKGKTVVIVEDIIDTGITIDSIMHKLKELEPAEIRIATLIFKPDAFTKKFPIDYIGIKIPNDFIVGYGLDYDGYGRNLEDIYTVVS